MIQTGEKPRLADDATEYLNRGKWPARLAEEYVDTVWGMTREEAMRTVQYAIRHGAGRNQKFWNPKSFLTDDIDLFYSHTLS